MRGHWNIINNNDHKEWKIGIFTPKQLEISMFIFLCLNDLLEKFPK